VRADSSIVIGKIVAPIGIRGEVKVVVLTDFPERFEVGSEIALNPPKAESRRVKIAAQRPHKGGLTIKLDGVDTREGAEALRNAEFVIDQSELAELSEGEFYVFDIIGLRVVTDDGRECGEVTEVVQSGANDVYVTSTGLCIPALRDVVARVDLDKGEMVIRPVPGLLD
jgi:16S rRNA processing protein RimM